jgi:hypothetical protein
VILRLLVDRFLVDKEELILATSTGMPTDASPTSSNVESSSGIIPVMFSMIDNISCVISGHEWRQRLNRGGKYS